MKMSEIGLLVSLLLKVVRFQRLLTKVRFWTPLSDLKSSGSLVLVEFQIYIEFIGHF